MLVERWIDCGYQFCDTRGPLGMTYLQILESCCTLHDPDFVIWLVSMLSPPSLGDEDFRSREWQDFWLSVERSYPSLDRDALRQFASDNDDVILARVLELGWTQSAECAEPLELNPLLATLSRYFRNDAVASSSLRTYRDEFLRMLALKTLASEACLFIHRLFTEGSPSWKIADAMDVVTRLTSEMARMEGRRADDYFRSSWILRADGTFNLNYYLYECYNETHPLGGTIEWGDKQRSEVSKLYLFLSIEGYSELIKWIRSADRSDWDAIKEIHVVRIAAYLEHSHILDMFLTRRETDVFHSSLQDCFEAAMLGAAEAGDAYQLSLHWRSYSEIGVFSDPISDATTISYDSLSRDERKTTIATSIVGSTVYGYLKGRSTIENLSVRSTSAEYESTLRWIVANRLGTPKTIVRSASLVSTDLQELASFERCYFLLTFIGINFDTAFLECEHDIMQISKGIFAFADACATMKKTTVDSERLTELLTRWLGLVLTIGVDLNQLTYKNVRLSNGLKSPLEKAMKSYKALQLQRWSLFDHVNKGRSLDEIEKAFDDGDADLTTRYRGGFLLSHLAASYNRVDVLSWLVESKEMLLSTVDLQGRNVLDVAKASNATAVMEWITMKTAGKTVAVFASSNFRRRRALQIAKIRLQSVVLVQTWYRGYSTRRSHRPRLMSRLDETQRFHKLWSGSIRLVVRGSDLSWNEMKRQQHDIKRAITNLDDDNFEETARKLQKATARALWNEEVNHQSPEAALLISDDEWLDDSSIDTEEMTAIMDVRPSIAANAVNIKLTSDVMKWLKGSDGKFRSFFVRRMKQLASGDRSRILAKRLTGSKTTIFETYLEQKSGHRILWTANYDGSLLIWYVAKHKSVSRLIRLIDDAENRSRRQLTSASTLPELEEETVVKSEGESDRIMLDPLSDTPLKLYEVHPNEIAKLSDPAWKPRLFLTKREREIVELPGTVLLLGRSGTGKTCVIANRIGYDRQRHCESPSFSQLFIARSQGLCDYVKEVASDGGEDNTMFETFNKVIASLENTLPVNEFSKKSIYLPSMKMDFARFKREFYDSSSSELDALVIWTNIRSFIKGSIEALQQRDRVLKEKEYLELGKKRCRLSLEQRKFVYSTFVRYEKYVREFGFWDDCDRITALVLRLQEAQSTDSHVYQDVRYNKLYVDEVQDYTQAEVALFFYLCGPGDLFLAGDPAQSVVEGVEFRFEDIRSVGYHLYGEERRNLIPDKPKTVHVNFRSHIGILNVAAAVLTCLFDAFPDSTKQLKEDRGLFEGPRPGVFHKVEAARLKELVTKRDGIVVLTHDRNVSKWKRELNDYPLVYGIREAKGLEFQEVVLVDFFASIPKSLQRLWRDLLLGRDTSDVSSRPEIEGHLKLLYTAITRCMQRLFFAETMPSIAGDAFVRWLTTTSTARLDKREALAVKNSVKNVETMTRTPDEWRSAGLDNAVMAETSNDLNETLTWLDRALYCFDQVGDNALASRARAHRTSVHFRMNAGDVDDMEVEAAILAEQLLSEQLFGEARNVCDTISPVLGERSRELLLERLVSKLPTNRG